MLANFYAVNKIITYVFVWTNIYRFLRKSFPTLPTKLFGARVTNETEVRVAPQHNGLLTNNFFTDHQILGYFRCQVHNVSTCVKHFVLVCFENYLKVVAGKICRYHNTLERITHITHVTHKHTGKQWKFVKMSLHVWYSILPGKKNV